MVNIQPVSVQTSGDLCIIRSLFCQTSVELNLQTYSSRSPNILNDWISALTTWWRYVRGLTSAFMSLGSVPTTLESWFILMNLNYGTDRIPGRCDPQRFYCFTFFTLDCLQPFEASALWNVAFLVGQVCPGSLCVSMRVCLKHHRSPSALQLFIMHH